MRRWIAALATATVALVFAGEARADNVTINAFTTTGQADMVAGVARIWSISGTAANPIGLFIKTRPPGGQPCAPSAASDTGDWFSPYYSGSWNGSSGTFPNRTASGAFDDRSAYSWDTPGSYQFCYWFADSSTTIVNAITQTILVRRPTGSITATIGPATPRPGQEATVTVTGSSESPETVYASVQAAGTPCAPTYDSASGTGLISGTNVEGMFTLTATTTQQTPGNYVVCLWLASSKTDAQPIAGPQPQPFSVVQPPPVATLLQTTNCQSTRTLKSIHRRSSTGVCVRYKFATPPLGGQKVTVSFYTPAGKRSTTLSSTWDASASQPVGAPGSLAPNAYRNRRGTWKVVLNVNGKQVRTGSFKVVR